jgi:DNA invertase Pin-like site-specific DNA recombinase
MEVDNQRRQLRKFCETQGWQIVAEYSDEESGAKSDRDGFQQMWRDAAQRKCLTSLGINWRSHTEQYLDSTGFFRDAVIAILAAIAKQERVRIGERTRTGLDRAREKGTRSGKPIGRPRVVFARDQVAELRREGLSWRQIAKRLGASSTAVRRAATEANTKPRCKSECCRDCDNVPLAAIGPLRSQ